VYGIGYDLFGYLSDPTGRIIPGTGYPTQYSDAGLWIRIDAIRIHNVIESGSNPDPDTDPDPQQYFRRQIFSKIIKSTKKVIYISSLYYFIPFRYKNKQNQLKKYLFFFIFLPLDPDPRSGFPIRFRIYKVIESRSNPDTDPDPQPCSDVR
jgi:hypothetical protein